MIYLTKGQTLFENPSMVVFDSSGYYEDGIPVICASLLNPDEPVCRYEAKFVAYGSQVYSISDEEKLLEEVLKIDGATLLGKTSEDVDVDKMLEKIETGSPEDTAKKEDLVTEDSIKEPELVEPEETIESTPESTPDPEPIPIPIPDPEVIPVPVPESPTEVVPEITTEQVVRLFNKKTKRKIS